MIYLSKIKQERKEKEIVVRELVFTTTTRFANCKHPIEVPRSQFN